MGHANVHQLIYTVKDKCRMCYTCVRECPAKAIKIINGQAEVINERCIGCGNCLNVCSQHAKVLVDLTNPIEQMLLNKNQRVAALVAPSFPAEFGELSDPLLLPALLRRLGFVRVFEVAFGADLVAREYKKLYEAGEQYYINSDCPAIVFYIEQYYPELIPHLAPVASPMVAMARVIKQWFKNENLQLVFIGPCIAKKAESDEIDGVLTFKELRGLFKKYHITLDGMGPSEFDEPKGGYGAIFPLTQGMSKTMYAHAFAREDKIIAVSGKKSFKEALKAFNEKEIRDHHLELLCCEGCIMGPGISEKNKEFSKYILIQQYVHRKLQQLSFSTWEENIKKAQEIDLSQQFHKMDRRLKKPSEEEIQVILKKIGKIQASDHLNCGACGYDTCYDHAVAIYHGFAEEEMCLPFTVQKLHKSIAELNETNEKLKNARLALRHSEKLAILGQISAGIAHELNNPLGIITMYGNLLLEELDNNDPKKEDIQLIVEQTQRCKQIVSGLLNFARKQKVKYQLTHLPELLEKASRQLLVPSNVQIVIATDMKNPYIMLDPDQFMDVLVNLYKNAIEAMPKGGVLQVSVEENESTIKIHVKDQGIGIPEEHREKLFMPFFTTKEVGKGTGLGLALVYGIVKMHQGKIEVLSNADPSKGPTYTEFIISLPRKV